MGGSGKRKINILSDASQYDKPGFWFHISPFPETEAIHQTLNSSIDPRWLSCAQGHLDFGRKGPHQ